MANITFVKYMDNPGAGTSAIGNRSMYRTFYKQKFDQLFVREQGRVKYTVYRTENNHDTYYIHIKIPSEKLTKLYYDVVLELFTTDNIQKTASNIRQYFVRFYSNDASFVFTYARAFSLKGYFINELKQKINSKVFSDPSKVRNPKNETWYVKSLCFAYFVMEHYNLFSKPVLNQIAKKFSLSQLLMDVMDSDKKMAERQKYEEEIRLKKKAEKATHIKQTILPQKFATRNTKTSSVAKTAKVARAGKITKKTKKI